MLYEIAQKMVLDLDEQRRYVCVCVQVCDGRHVEGKMALIHASATHTTHSLLESFDEELDEATGATDSSTLSMKQCIRETGATSPYTSSNPCHPASSHASGCPKHVLINQTGGTCVCITFVLFVLTLLVFIILYVLGHHS